MHSYRLVFCYAANDNEKEGTELLYSPLSLAYMARHTPDHYDITLYDEYVGDPLPERTLEADLVAISSLTSGITRAYRIADTLRERGIHTVIGGAHATALPEEALEHFDTVVMGEGEMPWKEFLADYENGNPGNKYFGKMNVPLDELGTPAREHIHPNYHVPSVLTSRGCPYACSFCYLTVYKHRKYRPVPHETVLEDLETLRDEPIVAFTDENFIGYREKDRADRKVLLRKMIERKFPFTWGCQATVHLAFDPELMELMYRAGCRAVFIGFEASGEEDLKSVNKKQNVGVDYREVVRNLHKHKLAVIAATILGLDDQKKDYHKRLIRELKGYKVDFVRVFYMTAWPGTPLFRQLEKEGRISRDWDKLRQDMPSLTFKQYSHGEAIEARKQIIRAFFNWRYALRVVSRWLLIDRSFLWLFIKLQIRNIRSEKIRNARAVKKKEEKKGSEGGPSGDDPEPAQVANPR